MDTDRQLPLAEATGWKRGLYEDLMTTFRAPIVNWIIRTLTANEPAFMRYLWGQVKPVFDTRGFATLAVTYRDTILSAIADNPGVPTYDRSSLELDQSTYRDLQGQVATFDIVAPRLAVLFQILDRGLSGEPLGERFPIDASMAATAPFPAELESGQALPPTLLEIEDIPDQLGDVIDAVADRHGLGDGLPSVHRCLAQWPTFFARSWDDLEPILGSKEYGDARENARAVVDDFVSELPYRPQLDPTSLRAVGFSEETVTDLQATVSAFLAGPADSVIPTLPVFAAMADAAGPRTI